MTQTLYDQNFYTWLFENAQLLREGHFTELDVVNLIDELESLANRDKRELFSRMESLLSLLLKWQFRANKRSRSWEHNIDTQRYLIAFILEDSPILRTKVIEKLDKLYDRAIVIASYEARLSTKRFPPTCPYTLEQILDDDFYPESEVSHDKL